MKVEKYKQTDKCRVLNYNGVRCRRKATHEIEYHGDRELYFDTSSTWCLLPVCEKHYDEIK